MKYVHGTVVTNYGIASNNKGQGDGSNLVPLQTINFNGEEWTTVSAEAIRFGLRRYLNEVRERNVRRIYDTQKCVTIEADDAPDENVYHDDDLFGYMTTSAKTEDSKGGNNIRKSALDVERAISLTPYTGDIVFNATSDGEKGKNSLYSAEVHKTAYRYGFSLNGNSLVHHDLLKDAMLAINGIGRVGGNHSRNLFDFTPAMSILRVTREPAPRILNVITADGDDGYDLSALKRVAQEFDASELYIGGIECGSEHHHFLMDMGLQNVYESNLAAFNNAYLAV
jgi:CRISPR-associated protein Cst2